MQDKAKPEFVAKRVGVRDVSFGEDVTIIEPCNIYDCTIGDRCFIGPFVEIQKGVLIGRDCRIQSHSFICELVEIGADCFVSHGAMFINDNFQLGGPSRGDRSLWGSTRLGNRVSIGTNATILPVSICDDVVIGAGSLVSRDIHVAGIYAGNPARLLRTI